MPTAPSTLDLRAGEVAQLKAEGVSNREIARQLGVNEASVRRFLQRHGMTVAPDVVDAQISELDLLRAEVVEWRRVGRRDRADEVQKAQLYQHLSEAISAVEVQFTPPERDESAQHGHVQSLLLSDLHAGEVVDPSAINGMNEYSWEILERRMANILSSLDSYRENRPYPIEELHVWMLGDMVSGKGHAEIRETNEFPPAEQAVRTGLLLAEFVESLVSRYPRVVVRAVPGNHGRVADKPAAKNVNDSFDWIAYKIAEIKLANYIEAGSIDWITSEGAQLVVEIAGVKVLLFHGDGIKSTMPGVPWGGVMRRVNALRGQWQRAGVELYGFALGHFHTYAAVGGYIWMNGSVKGADEWSLKQFGSGDVPEQILITWNPNKRRHTDVSLINP